MVTTLTLPELKGRLDKAVRRRVGLLGCPVQSQGSVSPVFEGPFQLRVLHDSVLL